VARRGQSQRQLPGRQRGCAGIRAPGARSERYELVLTNGKKTWTCNVPENVWSKYQDGASADLKVRLTGGADCASLK